MDEIDEEIQAARELFEEELLKINARADQNPNAVIVIAKIIFKLDAIEAFQCHDSNYIYYNIFHCRA